VKILVVLPAAEGVYPAEAEARRIERVKSYSNEHTQIDVGHPAAISGFMPYGGAANALDLARNHLLIGERMIQAEQEGYDACVPFGMIDFGVEIARSRCTIPIVGQSQATYCMAAMMAERWGIISYQASGHAMMHRQLVTYGFVDRAIGWGESGMPNDEMPRRRDELFAKFVSEGKRIVNDGAELIVCHGMSMCPIEFSAAEYADGIGVPVLEGMGCAVAMAEAWVRTGTPYSRIRHPAPKPKTAVG
jgi:allantoin racemase